MDEQTASDLAHAIAEALEAEAPDGVVVGEAERAVIHGAITDFFEGK